MADIRDFISCLRHSRGEFAGKPFELFPWQGDYLHRLFNTKRPDGARQYRQSLLAIGRKNGKTQMSAGIGLYGLVADGEPGAEIVCVAGDREQASILFDAAKQMVESNETLSAIIKPYRKALAVPSTNSVLKVISSEAASKHEYRCQAPAADHSDHDCGFRPPEHLLSDLAVRRESARRHHRRSGVPALHICGPK